MYEKQMAALLSVLYKHFVNTGEKQISIKSEYLEQNLKDEIKDISILFLMYKLILIGYVHTAKVTKTKITTKLCVLTNAGMMFVEDNNNDTDTMAEALKSKKPTDLKTWTALDIINED
jgi:hypothetical protein